MTYSWRLNKFLPERKGMLCRILARGRINSILVEFQDGARFITNRYAVRKALPEGVWPC